MSSNGGSRAAGVAELRRRFDQSFAGARIADVAVQEDLLGISVATDSFAVRLREVSGVFADKKLTWLPGPVRELSGLVSLRGTVLPVYSLRGLLGYPEAAASRWLLVPADSRVALAFDQFDGYLRAPREVTGRDLNADTHQQHIREIMRTEELTLPILDLASVLERIATLVPHVTPQKEY